MELKKVTEQQQAQNLYFQTDLSSAEIARIVGVSTRTVSRWISKEQWRRIKEAARHAPSAIVEKLYFQLNEMGDYILSRPPGQRFPSNEEADTMRKLTVAIAKLKQGVALCESIDLMMRFTTKVAKKDLELAKKITLEANDFMMGDSRELQKPYEIQYGNDGDDCLYEDSVETMTDNESQSHLSQVITTEPATGNDFPPKTVAQNAPSLSQKNVQDNQPDTNIPAEPARSRMIASNPRDQKIFDDWQDFYESVTRKAG